MSNKSVIYETKGRAREYCELAMNIYAGCTHGCLYCYGPDVTHQTPADFHASARPRLTPNDIMVNAAAKEGDKRPVLLCFITNPYQPGEADLRMAREAITILHEYDHPVTILTKAGRLAQRDFNLFREGDSFGVTLTCLDEGKSHYWEPGAALPGERIANLMEAKARGIQTWVSLEPVIEALETISCIHASAPWVDHFKAGKMNYYDTKLPEINGGYSRRRR